MKTLLFSTILYLAGIVGVLYVRPALMFREDGSWKEFGLQDRDTSPFPFWLFCITWAFVSYMICHITVKDETFLWAKGAMGAATLATASQSLPTRFMAMPALRTLQEDTEEDIIRPPQKQSGGGTKRKEKHAAPGYYVLSKGALKLLKKGGYVATPAEVDSDTDSSDDDSDE